MAKRAAVHPVELQFSVTYALPKDRRFKMSKAVLDEAIEYWIETGESPDGMEVKPIAWVHEDRITEVDNDEEQFRDLLRRLLRSGTTVDYKVRGDGAIL